MGAYRSRRGRGDDQRRTPTSVQHRTQDKPSTEPKTSPNPHPFGVLLNKNCPTQNKSSPLSILKLEKRRQGQEVAEGMAKDTHPPAFFPHPLR